jgi:4-hydroxy-3-polyprenylbenzoate decarboxylase
MGIDATHKIPPETGRDWGRPVTVDDATSEAIREIAEALGI